MCSSDLGGPPPRRHPPALLHGRDRPAGRRRLPTDRAQHARHGRGRHPPRRAGRRADAMRQYRICTDLLRSELDVDPAPETDALYQPNVTDGNVLMLVLHTNKIENWQWIAPSSELFLKPLGIYRLNSQTC